MAGNERDPATDKTSTERCPLCGKPALHRFRPFCSRRCSDVDLNRWLSGAYAIPVVEEEDEDGGVPDERPGGLA